MRRKLGRDGDVFRPRGQLRREIELATRAPIEVVSILGPYLSAKRRERIAQVVAQRTRRLTVALERVHYPHNIAAVIRTADAHGLQTMHVVGHGVRLLASRRVTQGAHKWVDLALWPAAEDFISQMTSENKQVLVAAADGETLLEELDAHQPLVLVFGNETEGVSATMRRLAHGAFRIPMVGFAESLNISVAAGIALGHLRRQVPGDLSEEERQILLARFYLRAVRAGYEIATRGQRG